MMLCNDHCSFSATEDVDALSPLWHQVWFISGFQFRMHRRRHEPLIGDAGSSGNRVSGFQDRQQAQVKEKPMKARKRKEESSTPAKKDCGHALYPGQWWYHAVSNSAWLLVMGSWTTRFFLEQAGIGLIMECETGRRKRVFHGVWFLRLANDCPKVITPYRNSFRLLSCLSII